MVTKFLNALIRGIAMFTIISMVAGKPLGGTLPALAAPGGTTRVSVDSTGVQANGRSSLPSVSGDGRFVAYQSEASNLVAGDTNGTGDVFVHDHQTGTTTRISVDSSGAQANNGSGAPDISSGGRFVTFYSYASNLVAGDMNGMVDIFVHDRQTGATTRVSVDSSGAEANGNASDVYPAMISGDGRFVAFQSEASNLVAGDTNGVDDIFVHDRQSGITTRVSVDSSGIEANGGSRTPVISDDGRFVTFSSSATNLVPGDTNGKTDVFVHDIQTGGTTRVSVNSSGEQADGGGSNSSISGDGRYVVFLSKSNNLAAGAEDYEELVYVHDRQTGQTALASIYPGGYIMVGTPDHPTISSNGRYVAFSFYEKGNQGLMDIYLHDSQTGEIIQATHGGPYVEESSYHPSLSADGHVVAFDSGSDGLVSGDTNEVRDVFVYELPIAPDDDPLVVSISPFDGVTSATQIHFTVTFSEPVTGVTTDDFALTSTGNISGASVISVSGSGNVYSVEVNTGTGDGGLRLDVIDNDSIIDDTLNPLGGVGAGNGNFDTGDVITIDKTPPSVTSSLRDDPNPTSAESVRFTVTFSEVVYQVDANDFALTTTGGISGATVGEVSGSGNTYTVNVNTGSGDGTLRLDVLVSGGIGTIMDAAVNPLNGNFTTGEVYTINKSGLSAPFVTSSLRADPNPTAADNVNFTVTFSEAVNGVDTSDFSLTTTGGVSGAYVANVSGSGNTYTVTVGTGNGNGDLRLDIIDDDSIQNAISTPLGGPGTGNGNFTTGETYTIEKTVPKPPSVTSILRADTNPTSADVVSFTVSFSEAVSGVDPTDFSLSMTGNISGASITGVSGSGAVYSVTVATGSGDGTLRLDILDNDSILGNSGYPLGGTGTGNGNFTTGEVYTVNRVPVNLFYETIRSNGRNDGWVLEASENADQGGYKDSNSATFVLGDDNQNRQFRSILHFPTYYLPNNAVITRALLTIKRETLVGTDPFQTHQNIVVDIRSGAFGFIGPFQYRGLQVSDFQSPSSRDAVGIIQNNPLNGWYYAWLDSSAFEYINKYGITQIRLRFQMDDDNDMIADYLRFYSGDYDRLPERPQLTIEYYRQ